MDGISNLNSFLAVHTPQLVLSGVPEHYWPRLCKKLNDQIFDAGLAFQLVQIVYEDGDKKPYDPLWSVIAITDVRRNDPSHIYLVDHAWTFKANNIKSSLRNVPGLLNRMCNLMQIAEDNTEDQIEEVSKKVWKFANTYAVANEDVAVEDRVPVWYVMDELGSGIIHSDTPNFRAVPFIHIPEQMTYTLIFPIENVVEGETITRNYVEGNYEDPKQKDAMLIPWRQYDYFYDDFSQSEPNPNYFLEGHIVETLPDLDLLQNSQTPPRKLKVFSEYDFINRHLTLPDFEMVDNEEEADILWYIRHFKAYRELSTSAPYKFVNQFPFEFILTTKDLLAVVSRRVARKSTQNNSKFNTVPAWLPTSFNMKTELSNLVACYMQRQKEGLDNHWICKPYNLARGLDTYITDNLDFLCKLPLSGPKIAQKYIENPVLFERPNIGQVKFDIRYVVLLKSVNPTEVFIYRNFFLRFSNKTFSLDNFEDYEKHFTVMNYTEGSTLYRLLCEEFKNEWRVQYPDYEWSDIEKDIFKMFSDLFTAATAKKAPCGITKSPQSRALYAADIMLKWQAKNGQRYIQPSLLEVNWMPDCQRACQYYPDFYNDIFSVLFLNKDVNTCIKVL